MLLTPPDFKWTELSELAALLVAEDAKTDEQIAAAAGVTRMTLHRWKDNPQFLTRVTAHVEVFAKRVMSRGIARRDRRVAALQDRWERLHTVIEERAGDMAGVPGGPSGLLVRQIKGIGSKEEYREVEEYALDVGLLREMREHEKQAAQELGQWTERQELMLLARMSKELDQLSNAALLAIARGDEITPPSAGGDGAVGGTGGALTDGPA